MKEERVNQITTRKMSMKDRDAVSVKYTRLRHLSAKPPKLESQIIAQNLWVTKNVP